MTTTTKTFTDPTAAWSNAKTTTTIMQIGRYKITKIERWSLGKWVSMCMYAVTGDTTVRLAGDYILHLNCVMLDEAFAIAKFNDEHDVFENGFTKETTTTLLQEIFDGRIGQRVEVMEVLDLHRDIVARGYWDNPAQSEESAIGRARGTSAASELNALR